MTGPADAGPGATRTGLVAAGIAAGLLAGVVRVRLRRRTAPVLEPRPEVAPEPTTGADRPFRDDPVHAPGHRHRHPDAASRPPARRGRNGRVPPAFRPRRQLNAE